MRQVLVIACALIAWTAAFAAPPGDARTALERLLVRQGPYAGACRLSVDGPVNFYFANIGLYPLVADAPTEVRNYLDAYLRLCDPVDGTIDDIAPDESRLAADSHDAYSATFLRLASRYVEVTGDKDWWTSAVRLMKIMAYHSIALQMKAGGLVRVFQKGRGPAVGYLMDNCENYRGLMDFARMLARFGDPDAAYYRRVANSVASGISALFDGPRVGWRLADAVPVSAGVWFPDGVAQMFPQMTGVVSFSVAPRGNISSRREQRERCRVAARLCRQSWKAASSHDLYTSLLYAHYLASCQGQVAQARRIYLALLPRIEEGLAGDVQIHVLGYAVLVSREVGCPLLLR